MIRVRLLLIFSMLFLIRGVLFQCLVSWVSNYLFFLSFSHQLIILTLFSEVSLFVLISCAICFILFFVMRGVVIYYTFVFYFSFLFVSLMSFILVFSSPPLFVIMFLWVFLKKMEVCYEILPNLLLSVIFLSFQYNLLYIHGLY